MGPESPALVVDDSSEEGSVVEVQPAKEAFNLWQRVRVRDRGKPWEEGTVEEVQPLKVRKDGWPKAYEWDEVEPLDKADEAIGNEDSKGEGVAHPTEIVLPSEKVPCSIDVPTWMSPALAVDDSSEEGSVVEAQPDNEATQFNDTSGDGVNLEDEEEDAAFFFQSCSP